LLMSKFGWKGLTSLGNEKISRWALGVHVLVFVLMELISLLVTECARPKIPRPVTKRKTRNQNGKF